MMRTQRPLSKSHISLLGICKVFVTLMLLSSACAPSQPSHPVEAQAADIEITDPALSGQTNKGSHSLSTGSIWIELQERFELGSAGTPQEKLFIKAAFFKTSAHNPLFPSLPNPEGSGAHTVQPRDETHSKAPHHHPSESDTEPKDETGPEHIPGAETLRNEDDHSESLPHLHGDDHDHI